MLTKGTLESQLKDAMRAKDEVRRRTLRMILSAVKLAEVEKRAALDEGALLAVLQKEVKTRQEAIADAEKAGRPDLAADSHAELEVIKSYLPAALTPQELESIVREAIAEAGAGSPGDMGKVMKLAAPKTQGRADNREVSQLVRKLLGG
ncbi:MAG: GatB/YqeY domain-containing protein [Anaerolineales bacterium]|nr:GatB/YqeY domain-containing protein [Anaerolineales bacterium]